MILYSKQNTIQMYFALEIPEDIYLDILKEEEKQIVQDIKTYERVLQHFKKRNKIDRKKCWFCCGCNHVFADNCQQERIQHSGYHIQKQNHYFLDVHMLLLHFY